MPRPASAGELTRAGGELVQEGLQFLRTALVGLEAIVAELQEAGEGDLLAHADHPEVGDDLAPVLDRPDPRLGAVGDEPDRLVGPLVAEHVVGVLQGTWDGVVVLGCDEDEGVARVDGLAPSGDPLVVILLVCGAGDRRARQERDVEGLEIDELVLGVTTRLGLLENPVRDGFASAAFADGAENDADVHGGAPQRDGLTVLSGTLEQSTIARGYPGSGRDDQRIAGGMYVQMGRDTSRVRAEQSATRRSWGALGYDVRCCPVGSVGFPGYRFVASGPT
ncbi:hypothetical protein BN11_310016 [Nostocoides australiense Ben110]|uniref:Uncharacterized protein n=1 Tax=Nostocoides australiense Ben110 TaxID=1193182 RepID=W6JX29_9MICO|nr:hypothetical protein BN11_310016 [Tetrasphaera australiensis Ben110]